MVPDEDAGVLAAARAIAAGQPVDWAALESSAAISASLAAILRELKVVAEIAELHRSFPESASSLPGSSGLDASSSVNAATVVARPETATWGSLRLLERVGQGAFGDVFRAWDPRLDREVALKLLRQVEHGHGSVGSAVIDEGRLLARVRHPNVVTVYGADRIDGRVGLWMEFVKGRTLEAVLRDHGQFSAREAALIGLDLCRALAAVHHAGLIHRDIKAQNVMREAGGRTVLMDFGAGREDLDGTPPDMAGTPLYLAPEVFAGAAATVRSDIYSVGVLLYHLVSGSYPVKARTVAEIQHQHRQRRRAWLRDDRPDLPDPFVEAVERALAFDPAERYESAGAMQAALARVATTAETTAQPPPPVTTVRRALGRRLGIAAALMLAAAAAFSTWRWTGDARTAAAPRWILVGAFDNHTGDPRLNDVVQFAFEQELAQSHALTVVPPERIADTLSLMKRPATTRMDPATEREVCIRDGAIPIFASGRIDQLGKTYTINVTITDASSGASLLRAGTDAPDIDGILDAVRTLARHVRSGTGENAAQVAADAQLERVTTDSLTALQQYTRGVALVNERRWPAAELPLRDAVRADPAFASAQIMLAHTLRNQGRPAAEYLPAAERAFALSDALPDREKYFIAGGYYDMRGDIHRAVAAYETLVRAHPNDYWGTNNLVANYRQLGRQSEATAAAVTLAALRPNHFPTLVQAAEATLIQGSLTDARPLVARATALADAAEPQLPAFHIAWVRLFPAFELWATGHVPEAAARLDAIVAGKRVSSRLAQGVGMMNLALGRLRKANEAFLAMAIEDEPFEFLALVEMARGDLNAARAALLADPRLADIMRQPPTGPSPMDIWLLVRFGLVAEADALLKASELPDDSRVTILASRAELLAARGDDNAAMAQLTRLQNLTQPAAHLRFRELESLIDVLMRRGDLQSAATSLGRTDHLRPSLYPLVGSSGYAWLRLRARSLDVERHLGHTDRAAAIERELRELLQVADPDFAMLRELH